MEISNIWKNSGTTEENKGYRVSAELSNDNYVRNKKLDMSCAYGLSRGKYSPVCNIANVVMCADGEVLSNQILNVNVLKNYGEAVYTYKTKPYNYLLLATDGTNTSTTDQHNGISNFYNWGYSVDVTDNQVYSSYKLITGFTYNNTCLYIGQILCCNKTFTEFKDVIGLTDYIERFSNDYPFIISIRCGIVTGCEGGERNNNICFCSEYEHRYNKYTLDDNFYVTSVDKYDKSIDYLGTNSTTILGCAFSHIKYDITQCRRLNMSGSLTHIINKDFLDTAFVDCSFTDYFTKEPKVYYYYDFEKKGVEPIEKMVSSLGLVWCYDYATATTTALFTGSDSCYYPIQTNGFYEGDFVRGEQSAELKQAEWGGDYDDWYDDNGVIDNPDNNIYVDDVPLNNPTLSTNNTFNRTFILNKKSVNDLSNYLWNTDENVFNQLLNGLKLLGQNPLNGIIDLRLYPFDVSELSNGVTSSNITVGRTDTGIQGLVLNDNNCVIELGNCKLKGWNNNFLDYEPYTQALLYIPYVGVTNIDITTFINKSISVKLIVDLTTGQGTAVVFSDDIPMMYHTANIGVNIAVTGDNASAYAQGVINAGLSTAQGVVTTGLGVASKNIPVAVAGGVGVLGSAYSAFAQPLNIPISGNNTPNCCNYCPQHCYLIISSPIINKPKNYGHTIGYACEITTKISDVTGYSVFNNIDTTGLICTDTEKAEIINLLNSGVYL